MDELKQAITSLQDAQKLVRTAAATSASSTDPSDWASSMLATEREIGKQVVSVQNIIKKITPAPAPIVKQPMTIPAPAVPPAAPPAT